MANIRRLNENECAKLAGHLRSAAAKYKDILDTSETLPPRLADEFNYQIADANQLADSFEGAAGAVIEL